MQKEIKINPLSQSITLTTQTIDRRSRHFRNTIITVVSIAALALLLSLIVRSIKPLAILLFLPVAVTAFLLVDTCIIGFWRKKLLDYFTKDEIDLDIFSQTISMMKSLPKLTIDGMLRQLPINGGFVKNTELPLRAIVAQTLFVISKDHILQIGTVFCISIIVSTSIVFAVQVQSFLPLLGIATTPLCVAIYLCINAILWKNLFKDVKKICNTSTIPDKDYEKAITILNWESISQKKKNRLLQLSRNS